MTHRIGDVLKIKHQNWPEGSFATGPVFEFGSNLSVAGFALHYMTPNLWDIEVISTAKFYVNVDRDPVAGDVFRSDDPADADENVTYSPSGGGGNTSNMFWENLGGDTVEAHDLPPLRRLLIDGSTGQVVS